jgi:hypothetical protein
MLFERSRLMIELGFPKVLHRRQKMTLTSLRHAERDSTSSVAMLPRTTLQVMESFVRDD